MLTPPCCENNVWWSAAGSPGELLWEQRPVLFHCTPKAGRKTHPATSPVRYSCCPPATKVFTLVLYHSSHITSVSVWASFTSSKNFLTQVWSIWGPMIDLRTWWNSFKLIPDFARFVATALLSSIAVNAFLRCCRCWGLSFSAGLTPSASSLQRAKIIYSFISW